MPIIISKPMKKLILLFSIIAVQMLQGQILEPVTWATSVKKISNAEYELIATAAIDKGWHLYSQNVPEDGPVPTSFLFEGHSNYLKKGNTSESKGHTVNDPVFGMVITYFENKAQFKQRIKVRGKTPFKVKGTVEFMVCDNTRCLPPTEVDLEFNVE